METQILEPSWTAAHAVPWFDVAAETIGWLVLGALVLLALDAIVRRNRYRAVGVLSESDRTMLRDEIAKVERASTGELAVVVLERSDDHPQATWIAALCTAIGGALAVVPHLAVEHPSALLALLFIFGAIGFVAARTLPGLRRYFVSHARAHEMAEEQALQEFARLGMHRTSGRTGVLILVSLFERCVIVLGDDGIHAKVTDEHWLAVNRAILDGVRERTLADGLRAGIQKAGGVLAEHFPRSGDDVNELPDHLIVRER